MNAHPSTVVTLALARKNRPELNKALAQANLTLAAAIMAMDAADGPALSEQAAVEQATRAYAQALADLIRG